jgi:pimeloyl-ACP methyl ester carboxylesterase
MTPTATLNRNGLTLAVYSGGSQGIPLVFQHGLCGDAGQIAEAMAGLAPQRWTGLECPGHGASPMAEPSIARFADDVAALIETLGQPVALGGISMGAAIGSRLAVTRPDLVRALILVRPAWVCAHARANMQPNAEVGRLLALYPAEQARAIFTASPTAQRLAQVAPDNLNSLLGFFSRKPLADTARLLTTISADGPDITEAQLRALRLPALICGCGEDAIHPYSHAQTLAALIPNSRLVELPAKARNKAEHLSALNTAMTQFLQEISHASPE